MPGALVYGANTSDRVAITAATAINSLAIGTAILWIYATALTLNARIISKRDATRGWEIQLNGATGALLFTMRRGLGGAANMTGLTTTIPITLNKWFCVCGAWDTSGNTFHIYIGDLATAMAEPTTVTSVGSGAVSDDSGLSLYVGNSPALTLAWTGRIAMSAVYNVQLSQASAESWRLTSRKTLTAGAGVMFGRQGTYGADFTEYTGLTAAVTGATQGDGPPLYQGGGRWQAKANSPFQSVP